MRPSRSSLAALAALFSLLGCQPAERAILIDVHSQEDVENLTVTVIGLDSSSHRWTEPTRRVRRTADDINTDPIRVAVVLGAPMRVLVHLTAQMPDGGGTLVATRCYPADSVIHDEVLLVGPIGAIDSDGDTFITDPLSACREPGLDGATPRACDEDPYVCPSDRAADCNEGDPAIYPGAPTTCGNSVDEDCSGDGDEPCGDHDGDGVPACPEIPTGPCDCNDNVASIHPGLGDIPPAEDICLDGIDQDCTDGDACCDADGDLYLACANGLPDCDDDNERVNPGATEVCDGVDNDCNGQVDELDECRGPDLDGDGVAACGREEPGEPCDCNDCDAAIHPNAPELCGPRAVAGVPGNGIDEDCDGLVDEGCRADDVDGDGVEAARDCDDANPLVFPPSGGREPIDYCGDGIAGNCIPGEDASCATDSDGDRWAEPAACEGNAAIRPDAAETCNGVDDDCDGVIDEMLRSDRGCVSGTTVVYATAFTHCGGCRIVCDPQISNRCAGGTCECEWNVAGGACASTDTCCPGIGCAALQDDENNCGVCGNACGLGETCAGGRCTCGVASAALGEDACPDSSGAEVQVCCDAQCRDLRDNDQHCGQCGLACGWSSSCIDGACTCDPPAGGSRFEDCNGDLDRIGNDGCEINTLGSDENHCGSCSTICRGGQATWRCNAGSCEPASCVGSFDDCDNVAPNGCEADLTRPVSCGACAPAASCGLAESCDSSFRCTCGPDLGTARGGRVCTPAETCCPGPTGDGCVTVGNDTRNCGGCGTWCGASETCAGGRCTCAATSGTVGSGEVCVGTTGTCCPTVGCINTNSNVAHCGGCGVACALGEACSASACRNVCGNAIVTSPEACDDGNVAPADGCSGTCTVEPGFTCAGSPRSTCTAICGDGLRRGAEACDDGALIAGDGCSSTCTVEGAWTCNTASPTVCTPICGNSQRHGGETCDDGNATAADGCSATCRVETGWTCPGVGPGSCTPICGNGQRHGSEACDDGDASGGDGCSGTCTIEPGWSCTSASPSVCSPVCGDGARIAPETCDDGNAIAADGCSATCRVETGWTCPGVGAGSCTPICGDGLRLGSEACDDGNTSGGDGCTATCTVAAGWTCNGASPTVCLPTCGNSQLHGAETCDDGNAIAGDGCSGACAVETGWTCTGTGPGSCAPICGDGLRLGSEGCDDGGTSGGDGCTATCTVAAGWSCNGASPSVCTPICGNGQRHGAETCDDGYEDACGTCNATCTGPGTGSTCGDGTRCRETEACDDGFEDACGTCNATCTGSGTGSTCGDGTRCPETEACDDRNTNACGTCNATCTGAGTGATCPADTRCSVDGDCASGNCTGANRCN